MASPDLQTQRMQAFTKLLRSGKGIIEEYSKETPSEKRAAEFQDYEKRLRLKTDVEHEALLDAEKQMLLLSSKANIAEMTYGLEQGTEVSREKSAGALEALPDFAEKGGIANKALLPGQDVKGILRIRKFKGEGVKNLMEVLNTRMQLINVEMLNLQQEEKYGGITTVESNRRKAALKTEIDDLHSDLTANDNWVINKMAGESIWARRGTTPAERKLFKTHVDNLYKHHRYFYPDTK